MSNARFGLRVRNGLVRGITEGQQAIFLDPDAVAFLTAAGITDSTIISAINTLVVSLKNFGIWTKMRAIYPFVGGTAASHKWNLKDPRDLDAAFRLVFSGGWTHSSTGALPNGTNAYADTRLKPNTMAQNSAHISSYSRTDYTSGGGTTGALMGVNETGRMYLMRFGSTSTYVGINSVGGPETGSTNWRGLLLGSRIDSTKATLYKNGSLVYNAMETSIAPESLQNILIAAYYRFAPTLYVNVETAFNSIGDGLTSTDASNLYTAVQAFQTTLGRQVV